jgi:hypothetical protein
MPEDSVIDGSNLEGNVETPPVQEAVQPSVEQPAQENVQPPQSNIPEQYREYTPEQWFNEWNKANSTLGRYKQAISTLRQKTQGPVYPPQAYQNPQYTPSSLPGEPGPGQTQQQKDLNEAYLYNPADVVKQIVAQEVSKGIQGYTQQQTFAQQQAAQNRLMAINRIDDDELANLRLDENVNFTSEHEALMESLAKRDPEANALLNKPDLTEADIRKYVRDIYARADKILNGDTERLKAFTAAQKQAAVQGAPIPRSSTSTGPETTPKPADIAERWGFLWNQ